MRGAVDDPYPRTVRETCTYVGKNIVDVRNLLGRSETVDVILGSIESQYIVYAVARNVRVSRKKKGEPREEARAAYLVMVKRVDLVTVTVLQVVVMVVVSTLVVSTLVH